MIKLILHLLLCQQAFASESPVLSRYLKAVGDPTAKTAVHVLWTGQAYGVSGTLEDKISADRWSQDLRLPDASYSDRLMVEGNQVTEFDTNEHLRTVSGTFG